MVVEDPKILGLDDQGSVPECGVVSGGIDVWFRDGWQVEGLCGGGVVSCWLFVVERYRSAFLVQRKNDSSPAVF